MKATLVNCSYPRYNLGLVKYANYLAAMGWEVEMWHRPPGPFFAPAYDLVGFSAIFSWDVPALVAGVNQVRGRVGRVEIGGPGTLALAEYIEQQTGIAPVRGLDPRFDRQPGTYAQTFTTRGCPCKCPWCIVPQLEGRRIVEYPNFTEAPMILDNNILAASVEHQERVVERLLRQGYPQVDFTSGFDARLFDQTAYDRFSPLPLKCWRFAFDELGREIAVREALALLRSRGVRPPHVRVYVLAGNEPLEDCLHRAQRVIAWGAEPFVQPFQPLDALHKNAYAPPSWEPGQLTDFARYFNRYVWRRTPWAKYDRNYRARRRRAKKAQVQGVLFPSRAGIPSLAISPG